MRSIDSGSSRGGCAGGVRSIWAGSARRKRPPCRSAHVGDFDRHTFGGWSAGLRSTGQAHGISAAGGAPGESASDSSGRPRRTQPGADRGSRRRRCPGTARARGGHCGREHVEQQHADCRQFDVARQYGAWCDRPRRSNGRSRRGNHPRSRNSQPFQLASVHCDTIHRPRCYSGRAKHESRRQFASHADSGRCRRRHSYTGRRDSGGCALRCLSRGRPRLRTNWGAGNDATRWAANPTWTRRISRLSGLSSSGRFSRPARRRNCGRFCQFQNRRADGESHPPR